MYWVCISDVLIAFHFHFTAGSSFPQVSLSACFEDFIKKLALVQCALGSDTIQRSLITMTSLLFPFPFLFCFPSLPLLCVGEEKKAQFSHRLELFYLV